jgi:L-lactate dehydrogenase complex protein LldF
MQIPLPDMLRSLRARQFDENLVKPRARLALGLWARIARRPRIYALATGIAARILALLAGRSGRLRSLPFAGGWTSQRDLPAPTGRTFRSAWKRCGGRIPS